MLLGLLLIGCSQSPSSQDSIHSFSSGLYQYDPCKELKFSEGLTETSFTRLVECLHVNHGITQEVRDLLVAQPQFAVDAFNALFADEKIRQESFQLFESLEASGGLDVTVSFLGSLIGSKPFEKLFLKTDDTTKSLAQYLVDDAIDLSKTLAQVFSSPHFSDFQKVLDKLVTEDAFPRMAGSLGDFLTKKIDGTSGADTIVDLLSGVSNTSTPLLTADEIHALARNRTGASVMRTLSRHAYENPALITPSNSIPGLTGQFTLFSSFLWKLSHTQTPLIYNSGNQKDLEMLLEFAQTLNRTLIIENTGTSFQPHLLVSLRKFLSSMVGFFSAEAASQDDSEEVIVKRLKIMSIYFIFVDLINKEMRDSHYASLDTQDRAKYVFDRYKTEFIFSSNKSSIKRIKKVFEDLKPHIEKLVEFFTGNPIITYLNELEKNNVNLISAFVSKADVLLSDPELMSALQKTIQQFFEFNQPIDEFLKQDMDEAKTETWLDYTLGFIKTSLREDISLTDMNLITSVVKTYQIQEEMLKGQYFQGLPLGLFSDLLTNLKSSDAFSLLPVLLSRIESQQTKTSLMTLLNRLITSRLLDVSLAFAATEGGDMGDICDKALEELTASAEKKTLVKKINNLDQHALNLSAFRIGLLNKKVWDMSNDTDQKSLIAEIEGIATMPQYIVTTLEALKLNNQTRLVSPLLTSFIKLAHNPVTKTKLRDFLEAIGDFFSAYEVQNGESNHYLTELVQTYKIYRDVGDTALSQYFTKEENLQILFTIMAEAIQKDVASEIAPLFQNATKKEELKNQLKSVFKVMANVLRYSGVNKGDNLK